MNRVYCNGIGVASPFGKGVKPYMEAFKEGKTAIGVSNSLKRVPGIFLGSEVEPVHLQELSAYDSELGIKRFALTQVALLEALEQSGQNTPYNNQKRVGIFLGSGSYLSEFSLSRQAGYLSNPLPNQDDFRFDSKDFLLRALALPGLMPAGDYDRFMRERLLAQPSSLLQFTRNLVGGSGEIQLINNLCVSSLQAIGQAYRSLQNGDCDIAVVGGVEELSIISYLTFHRLGVYSQAELPEAGCRPFDVNRKGIVLGEGAAFMVLSREKQGACAEILAYASGNNCYHLTDSAPDGEGLYAVMAKCVKRAGVKPDLIIAHGTGTRSNDPSESKAILRLFSDHEGPYVQSIKSRIGHTLAAAGIFNVVTGILQAQSAFVGPTLGLTQPDSECQVRHVPAAGLSMKLGSILCNAAGFGGFNASMILDVSLASNPG